MAHPMPPRRLCFLLSSARSALRTASASCFSTSVGVSSTDVAIGEGPPYGDGGGRKKKGKAWESLRPRAQARRAASNLFIPCHFRDGGSHTTTVDCDEPTTRLLALRPVYDALSVPPAAPSCTVYSTELPAGMDSTKQQYVVALGSTGTQPEGAGPGAVVVMLNAQLPTNEGVRLVMLTDAAPATPHDAVSVTALGAARAVRTLVPGRTQRLDSARVVVLPH